MTNLPNADASRLTQQHVQALARYAAAMDSGSIREYGEPTVSDHTAEVRVLAQRIQQFVSEDVGAFAPEDVALLASIGDGLVRNAIRVLNDPNVLPEQHAHAQYRLGLGNTILVVRDRVEQCVKK